MLNNIFVVSDIDDTIKWSHILGPDWLMLRDGLDPTLAFKGMPELYTSLASAGASFAYVTGGPDLLVDGLQANLVPKMVIEANRFPQGDRFLRQLGEETEDFKVTTITQIMRENPSCDFILIGDNGERDVDTYAKVRRDPEVGHRVKEVFIHKIYSGGKSLEPTEGQHPFVTAAELAAMLYGFELLDDTDLTAIVKIVDEGMKDEGRNHNLTLPFAAQLQPDEVDGVYGALPTTIDSQTQDLLEDIHRLILEQAKQGPHFWSVSASET
jgi:hypothetical protein